MKGELTFMKLIISGKNLELTEGLKDKIKSKIGKLDKFFSHDTEVHVTMSVQKNHHILEVTINYNGVTFRAEVTDSDMYAAIDRVVDIVEGQIRKNKTRLAKKLHEGAFRVENMQSYQEIEEDMEYNVVRSKKFSIKPMTVEEAILQMNLIGHVFFMFSNAETKGVNLVYKRKDGNYGLIEPEY
jgi:putative sigma-54 modulation protein